MRLFVYGSLLSGERHHDQLGGSPLVGAALTEPRYTLVDLGAYPALLEEGTTAVAGEVYDVDDERLAVLDEFEGHPDEYRRMPVGLIGGGSAEAYVLPRSQPSEARVIASGNWRFRHSRVGPSPGS